MKDMKTAVKLYRALQAKIDDIEAAAQAQTAELKNKQHAIEMWISQKSLEDGVDSFKTEFGTAFFQTSDYCSVADWDSTFNWIKASDKWDVLTKGVNKTAVREIIKETGAVPPGLNYGTKRVLHVRKPSTI